MQPTPEQMQQMKVNLSTAATISCEECECTHFTPIFFMKQLSALMSPTGKDQLVPIQSFHCSKCGHVNKEFDLASQEVSAES
jgi:hypothetical protein